MRELNRRVDTLQATDDLGALLAAAIPEGMTIALSGTLGAGKTRLVQAMAAAWKVPRETVVSPTFVLCQQYSGDRQIYHLDAYRLRDEDEFMQLGVEELFDSPAVTIIEWAERVERCLPVERLEIDIEVLGEQARHFVFRAYGPAAEGVLERLDAAPSPPQS